MNKSMIILLVAVWLICIVYCALGRINAFPFVSIAVGGAWITSALLLVCIVMFMRNNRSR